MFSRLRIAGRIGNRRWASSSSHDAGFERASAVYEERVGNSKNTVYGVLAAVVIFGVGYTSVKNAKWPDQPPTPYPYREVKQQLSIEDRDHLMKEWAEESKNMKGSHWITNMIARGIPDREANQEALRERLKEGKETAEKRLELWSVVERMPPKKPAFGSERSSAVTVLDVHNH